MSEGKLCKNTIKIHDELPLNCDMKPKETEGIYISCFMYHKHEGKHMGTIIDNNGNTLGDIKW